MLMTNQRLRKLGGFGLFDHFQRRMTLTVGEYERQLVMMPYDMHNWELVGERRRHQRIEALTDASSCSALMAT